MVGGGKVAGWGFFDKLFKYGLNTELWRQHDPAQQMDGKGLGGFLDRLLTVGLNKEAHDAYIADRMAGKRGAGFFENLGNDLIVGAVAGPLIAGGGAYTAGLSKIGQGLVGVGMSAAKEALPSVVTSAVLGKGPQQPGPAPQPDGMTMALDINSILDRQRDYMLQQQRNFYRSIPGYRYGGRWG
jgi:hypothetical protein